jgi:hypothetical protein
LYRSTSLYKTGEIHSLVSIPRLHKRLKNTGSLFVDVYGHLGIDSTNRFQMKN